MSNTSRARSTVILHHGKSLQALAVAVLLGVSLGAAAQDYPSKPIRLVVPFPPGGGNDTVARTMNLRLPGLLGQGVVIDHRPGAGGNIGAEIVAKAPSDGYTLLVANNSLTINLSLFSKLPFHPFKDFVPITMGATSPNVVVVHPSIPVRSVKELIALVKAQPGQITFASAGPGTPSHMAGELFRVRTGSDFLTIHYKGGGPLVVAMLGGHVMMSLTNLIIVRPHIETKKLRALAVTTEKRSALVPDLPTVAEAGYPGFDTILWVGYFAPAGTPRVIIDRLAADIGRVSQMPEIRKRFGEQGMEGGATTPAEFAAYLRKDWELWDRIIKEQGIKLD